MTEISLIPNGPFSLAASTRFLEGFIPANYRRPGCVGGSTDDGTGSASLRLAFTVEETWQPAAVAVRERFDGVVEATVAGEADSAAVRDQLARILSLDIDGAGFADVAAQDAVVGGLVERYPGLRPVCFNSPYEAACWAIIGQRLPIRQAAVIRARITEERGLQVVLAGQQITAFPGPETLLGLQTIPGLAAIKVERLHAIARAALDGQLSASALRAMDSADALTELRRMPGVGPFSADLILIRGAGSPDCFPTTERRLHDSMAAAYGLNSPSLTDLLRVAEQWRPYRSWVALLLRTHREVTTGEIARGRRVTVAPAASVAAVTGR